MPKGDDEVRAGTKKAAGVFLLPRERIREKRARSCGEKRDRVGCGMPGERPRRGLLPKATTLRVTPMTAGERGRQRERGRKGEPAAFHCF